MALTSDRGRIDIPKLDDRTWQDLVDQMLGLINTYAPQWTDRNPSDLGITLIELFAWLVEGLIFRLDQVPEKNYLAFLNLLGVTRNPATPAHAYLTFTTVPNATTAILVPKGTQAQTAGDETRVPITFETDEDLYVQPINLRAALIVQVDPSKPSNTYTNVSTALTAPPAKGLRFTVPQNPNPSGPQTYVQLCLGFEAPTPPTALDVMLHVQLVSAVPLDAPTSGSAPRLASNGTPSAIVQWFYSNDDSSLQPPNGWKQMVGPSQTTAGLLDPYLAQTDPYAPAAGFQKDGLIHVSIPPLATAAFPSWPPWKAQNPKNWPAEFDLRLMSWGDGSGVPSSGKNLVVVGTDNNGLLHIRIFDVTGNRTKDMDESQLPAQAAAISTLKQQLATLMSPHVLTDTEKEQVVAEATSIVGQTRPANSIAAASSADALDASLYWIAARILNTSATASAFELGLDFLLFNSVSAHNALTIPVTKPPGEVLGLGDDQPFQTFKLKNYPLYSTPNSLTPYDHLKVQVDGNDWSHAEGDDLPAGPVNQYMLSPVTGEVLFGNYDSKTDAGKAGHGSIPSAGSEVVALTYRYVAGGAAGNVGPGAIGNLTANVTNIIGVTNLFAAFDGSDEEPIDETIRRAPDLLRTGDRAVTKDDYIRLAREASTDVAIATCLAPQIFEDPPPTGSSWKQGDPWTFGGIDRSPGNVTVIIVPNQGLEFPQPAPTKDLLQTVQTALDAKRSLAAHLVVTSPRYLPVGVKVKVTVFQKAVDQGVQPKDVQDSILNNLGRFLHPVMGGPDGSGWQFGGSVFLGDVLNAIMPREDIGYITDIQMADQIPSYYSDRTVRVQLASASGTTVTTQNPSDAGLFKTNDRVAIETNARWVAEQFVVSGTPSGGVITPAANLQGNYGSSDAPLYAVLVPPSSYRPFSTQPGVALVRVADYEIVCFSQNSYVNVSRES